MLATLTIYFMSSGEFIRLLSNINVRISTSSNAHNMVNILSVTSIFSWLQWLSNHLITSILLDLHSLRIMKSRMKFSRLENFGCLYIFSNISISPLILANETISFMSVSSIILSFLPNHLIILIQLFRYAS